MDPYEKPARGAKYARMGPGFCQMSHSHVIPIHVKFRQGDLVNFVQDLFVGEKPSDCFSCKMHEFL